MTKYISTYIYMCVYMCYKHVYFFFLKTKLFLIICWSEINDENCNCRFLSSLKFLFVFYFLEWLHQFLTCPPSWRHSVRSRTALPPHVSTSSVHCVSVTSVSLPTFHTRSLYCYCLCWEHNDFIVSCVASVKEEHGRRAETKERPLSRTSAAVNNTGSPWPE